MKRDGNEGQKEMLESRPGFSRRDFIKGTVAGAAVLGVGSLAGCSTKTSAETKPVKKSEAEPIPPIDPPDKWDAEADIIVVGTGGGGLAASLYAAENGASVITIEKNTAPGGSTQHACGYFDLPGGSTAQEAMKYAYPDYPFDVEKFTKAVMPYYNHSVDPALIRSIAQKCGEATDWIMSHGAEWMCVGMLYAPKAVLTGKAHPAMGMHPTTELFAKLGADAGADFHYGTQCSAFVVENGRVIGVKATENSGKELYFHAKKGVVLCAGGFGMNKDMLAKYTPTAAKLAFQGGPMPYHTGECTRMGLGVGADISGFDSWCCWESSPDDVRDGDGKYWHYHWDGGTIICRQPWLRIDMRGTRIEYHASEMPEHPVIYGGGGDFGTVAVEMSRMGGAGYVIFDSNYETTLRDHFTLMKHSWDRTPTEPDHLPFLGSNEGLFSEDWRDDFAAAVKRGAIKKCDTIAELAKALQLDPDVLQGAVDHWNELCEKGEDTDLLYPYPAEWLQALKTPPYYGARIGGSIGKTMAGLRVTGDMEVVDTEGKVIPGLYAGWSTAGGFVGESTWNSGGTFNVSVLGSNALSWVTGYIACQTALEA
ncbi:MAG: FAD-dependent oxidoreductase [Coriobacteriia bacterium]